jgi:predicted RNA binding protein YcfA (HicA-like mRNA interferase family)
MTGLNPGTRIVHRDGSHEEWRLQGGSVVIVPVQPCDMPIGTPRNTQRQGRRTLGPRWLLRESDGA